MLLKIKDRKVLFYHIKIINKIPLLIILLSINKLMKNKIKSSIQINNFKLKKDQKLLIIFIFKICKRLVLYQFLIFYRGK